ncbi:hypothetical protein B0H14DRAFT_3646744 [Mycena olivaceomarginata]|nr:hypothetical protein B0H14DRAFT_3646744 [Mycena olivaceomarginata]
MIFEEPGTRSLEAGGWFSRSTFRADLDQFFSSEGGSDSDDTGMGEGKGKRVYSVVVTYMHCVTAEMNKYERKLASESEDAPKEPVLVRAWRRECGGNADSEGTALVVFGCWKYRGRGRPHTRCRGYSCREARGEPRKVRNDLELEETADGRAEDELGWRMIENSGQSRTEDEACEEQGANALTCLKLMGQTRWVAGWGRGGNCAS